MDVSIPKDLADICFKLLQKDPYKRYSSAKQVGNLLQNQANLPVLIGRKKQFEQIEKILQGFLQKEQSAILCLLGPSGVGRKDFIKYIVHQLKRTTIPISTEMQYPPPHIEKYCFWIRKKLPTIDFLTDISKKISLGDSVFFLVTKSQQLKLLEEHLPLMSFSILIPPLALSTRKIYFVRSILLENAMYFCPKLQHFFKGRQIYPNSSEEWLQQIEATPFKKSYKITIPIPEGLREQYNSHLKKLSKKRNNF